MKIILATDPVFWPLTGIGKYTLELARGLSREPTLADLRFFNMGHWQNTENLRQFSNEDIGHAGKTGWARKHFGSLRRSLANHALATRLYARITPYFFSQRLKPFAAEYLYHSPNFMLPPFAGRKISTFHDLSILRYPEFHPESRVAYLEPEILRAAEYADHIITDTETGRREVMEYFGKGPDEVTAVPLASTLNGELPTPAEIDEFLAAHGLVKGNFFLFVSSIEPRKNIARIVEAYAALPAATRRRHPLIMTGSSGWKSEALMRRINVKDEASGLQYLNYASDTDLKCLYASAGALVFPSIYEGFGLPILEAQTMGLPVLTSDRSCMPEVAGDAALLVDPFDVDAIKQGLEQIMLDDTLRASLRTAGLNNARRYSWESTVSKTLDVYRRVHAL